MTRSTYRFSSLAVILLFAGSTVVAQTSNTATRNNEQELTKAMRTYVPPPYERPWSKIKESDIRVWNRVWRDIDVNEKENKVFSSDAANINSGLVNVLLEGFFSGKIKAYDPSVSNFTKEFTRDELIKLITPGKGVVGFDPTQVTGYSVKEDWLLLNEGKMVVRIVGLAVLRPVTGTDGKLASQPLFMVYYPDIRNFLAEHKPMDSKKNWDEIFESREFKSKIVNTKEMPLFRTPVKH
jgi:hypothetical protein